MKAVYYGDRRDRIKWGSLAFLARRHKIESIFQIAYVRLDAAPTLNTDEGDIGVDPPVWQHFSDLRRAEQLAEPLAVRIAVYDAPFHSLYRKRYIAEALNALESLPRPWLVFLDPDTGIGISADHARP